MAAAAEARAAWQRVANRYIVQEDAKRAPKLACCPSSSSKLQHDPGYEQGDSEVANFSSNCLPLNWCPMNSNVPPDTKWWLHLQPNFGHQNDFLHEKLNKIEDEHENKSLQNDTLSKNSSELQSGVTSCTEFDENASSFTESPSILSTTFIKNDQEVRIEELKTVKSNVQHPLKHKSDVNDHWNGGDELMDWEAVDQLLSTTPDKVSFDMEPNWKGVKTEPWWRVNDKDDLALLVARKSSEHIENCDLPPPQRVHVSKDTFSCLEQFDDDEKLSTSSDYKLHNGIYKWADHDRHISSEKIEGKYTLYDEVDHSSYDSQKLYSPHSYEAISKSYQDKMLAPDSDSNKAELLEALCHSQTRARKAEIAAQKAYDEKEHIIKLFVKQASHLFAYKQWLHLLQLESLCLQLKIKDNQLSALFPVMPWMLDKDDQTDGVGPQKKEKKKKGKKQKCGFCRSLIAIAVGVSLASAGLLLGWTLGWLIPTM